MLWDFAEPNLFADSTGSISSAIDMSVNALVSTNSTYGEISSADTATPLKQDRVIICTDPPYYDNVAYSDLSDLFYVWLRKFLKQTWSDLTGTILTPKSEELVATPFHHGNKEQAEKFFMDGMSRAITNMATSALPDFPITIYYAFKQSEVAEEGVASTGWATFLQAIANAGLVVDGTLPIRTEMRTRQVAMGTNALASSVVLVCRKRPETAQITTRAAFLKALKDELPDALRLLQHGNIAPVDMAQASIGPGMATFTRYAKVLEADDSRMTVKTALQLINTALDEFLSEQEAEYDPHTRFAITWFETHGMEAGPYGTAEILATARGVAVSGVAEAGVLESRGGSVRLLRRDEMPDDWDPEIDLRLTIWECTQHLIRTLESEGEKSAADLLARFGERGDVARDLAYRLYGICERKQWADEALAYNGLVVVWPELIKLASSARGGPAQAELEI